MRLKGLRTMIFNVLAAVPLVFEAVVHVLAMPEVAGVLPEGWLPWYALGIALANMALRRVTTTPLGRAE